MAEGVWQTPAFLGLFGDPYLRATPYEFGGNPQALLASLAAFSQLLGPPGASESQNGAQNVSFALTPEQERVVAETLRPQLEFCGAWAEKGLQVQDAASFQEFLKEWKAALGDMKPDEPLLVPGGFIGSNSSHTIIYVIEKHGDSRLYSFTVCNKGPGAELYHPHHVESSGDTTANPKLRVQSVLQIREIPASRFLDMAFWALLWSLWVRTPPSEYHRVETLYDVLLPWLAGDKLLPLAVDEVASTESLGTAANARTLQRSNLGFCKSVVEALRYLCVRSGAFSSAEIKYLLLYRMRFRLFEQLLRDLDIANNPAKALPEGTLDSALQILSSISLLDSLQGTHNIAAEVAPDAVVGIFFAKFGSLSCRRFMRTLVTLTEKMHASNKKLFIVLVSVDQEQEEYSSLVQDLPAHSWLVVPFPEVDARKRLIQTFRVTSIPVLIMRGSDGNVLTTKGVDLVQSDPEGKHFPWHPTSEFALPKRVLSISEKRCIEMGVKQLGLKTLLQSKLNNIRPEGVAHVNALISQADALISENTASVVKSKDAPTATIAETIEFVPHKNTELLKIKGNEAKYAGNASQLNVPTLGNYLDVPEQVNSIALAVASFVRCEALCESLLTRAAEGSSSSRVSLHHEVIQLVTSLFTEVLPVPHPIAGINVTCMWRQPVQQELQMRCLKHIYSLLMVLGSVWQSMEQPTRQFDSDRSLAALCALSIFDAVLRTPASDAPMEISLLMNEDGGYVLAHRFCKANFTLQKMTSSMEFTRPNFAVVRGHVLAYFSSLDAIAKHQLYEYHMPEDKIEVKKYSTTLMFFRRLMERYHYQLIDVNNPNPPTEMEALMEWFCGDSSPMSQEHPEVALARDLVMVVKYLATMETKEVELMRRRAPHQTWQMWQLSFDDTASTHRRNFFGMRGLQKMLHSTLKWEVVNFRGSDQDIADVDVEGFMDRAVYFGEGSIVTSPADLGALLVKSSGNSALSLPNMITEDDIMHLSDLPTFNGTLSSEESEYLMSYLTVPYTRIPLVTTFFSSRDRVTYLFNPLLQNLLRAVLFESGDWVSDQPKETISHVPLRKSTLLLHEEAVRRAVDARVHHQKCEDYLGTMNGLLLNELAHAPEAVLEPLMKMLQAVKELAEASVYSADAKFILFMIKLGIDTLRYATYAIDSGMCGPNSAKQVQLEQYRTQFVEYLFGFARSTLDKWRLEAESDNNLQTACLIHSYLVYLHVSLRKSEYSVERLSDMIGSIAYVRNWHCFGMRLSIEGAEKESLTAEDRLLRWLQAQGINTANVSKGSLDKYLKGRPLYLKIGMQTIQAPSIVALRQSEQDPKLPPGEVLEAEVFETIQVHRRGIVEWLGKIAVNDRNTVLAGIVHIALGSMEPTHVWDWVEDVSVGGTGRYICRKSDLKLDTQTGEILWRNDELKPVPDSMTQYADFKAIFGNRSLHCGLVSREEHRLWVNIVGTDFQLLEWDDPNEINDQGVGCPQVYVPGTEVSAGNETEELKMYWECPACTCANFNGDNPTATCEVCGTPRVTRAPSPTSNEPSQPAETGFTYLGQIFSRVFDIYSEEEHPNVEEQWVVDLVGGALKLLYPPEPEDKKLPFTVFLPKDPLPASSERVRLLGFDQGPKEKKNKDAVPTFKEIVAYHKLNVVHIYSLVSHGRRMYRKLLFTSNSRLSLHGFKLNISPDDGPVDPLLLRAGGDPKELQVMGGSLVIVRKNASLNGTEQFVPPRLLQGVVPSCLLEAFQFWMGSDGRMRGEPVDTKSQWFRYRVEIELLENGGAVITKKAIHSSFSKIGQVVAGSMQALGDRSLPPPAPQTTVSPTSFGNPETPFAQAEPEIHDDDVVQLMAMGFSYAACGLSLRQNHNNVSMAAQWLLDEANQTKIVAAEEAAEAGTFPVSAEDLHEQNIALLMSVGSSPSRVACEYALKIFSKDLDLARAWLEDPGSKKEIERVELAQNVDMEEVAIATASQLPVPPTRDEGESKENDENEAMDLCGEAESEETWQLLNLLDAASDESSDMEILCQLLGRVEDLSHVLVWCESNEGDKPNSARVTLIELPRLKLRFELKNTSGGRLRLDVMDQNGWFVSDLTLSITDSASKYLRDLLKISPDCLIFESDTTDLKMVSPNHDVYRPRVRGEPFSILQVTDRGSVGWQQAIETRFYTYPIHSSATFLLPPSLSSTFYLILSSMLAREYSRAMEFILGCNVDVKFTDEEKWIFDQLAKTLDDRHPDACACRIRLSLAISYSDNKAPWKLEGELHDYFGTKGHVDATCKLTLEEEKEALDNAHQRSPLLALQHEYFDHAYGEEQVVFPYVIKRSRVGGQPWMKMRLFTKEYMVAHGKKLSTVRYNRPKHTSGVNNVFLIDEEEAGKLVWNCAVVGDEVSGTNRGLGFLFLYECLNKQVVIRLGGDDCTHSFGDLNARFLHLKLSRWGRETVDDGEEEYSPSYALAQLAMIVGHPHVMLPSSPCDPESTQMLSRGANLYSKFTYGSILKHFFDFAEMEFQNKLQSEDHRHLVIEPIKDQFNKIRQSSEKTVELRAASPLSTSDAIAPFSASDTQCDSRTFSASNDTINPEFPLEAVDVKEFITFCDPEFKVDASLPFDLTNHPAAQTVAAKDLLKRLGKDIEINANSVNKSKDAFIAGASPLELSATVSPSVLDRLQKLVQLCDELRKKDRELVEKSIARIEAAMNEVRSPSSPAEKTEMDQFVMKRRIGLYPRVSFDFLTSLLSSSNFESDLKKRNPFAGVVSGSTIEAILVVLFLCSRIVHINRTIQATRALMVHLEGLEREQTNGSSVDISTRVKQTRQASKDLADMLLSKRHYLRQKSDDRWEFDPRFVVFEYVFDLLLRNRQVQMIESFLTSLGGGVSRVQQMIMGAGKTTVVGPLLTYILADKQQLVTHVMPTALLEQSRQVLRSRFSNLVLRKRIFTFEFDRSVNDDPAVAIQLFEKLNRARIHGDVVCASPESIKSMMLKLVELLHSLEESSDVIQLPLSSSSQNVRRLRRILEDRSEMADELYCIIRLWQKGVLIMDEVDVLLHPLRSELNFPIGNKFPIDLAANRWELPIHLIDSVLANPKQLAPESEVAEWVQKLHKVLDEGYSTHTLQRFPHLVLLDSEFYQEKMMPLLAEIALVWLLKHLRIGKMEVAVERIKHYLLCPKVDLQTDQAFQSEIEHGLSESSIKLLNLSRDWLQTILPHVLSKINRVSYGLLRGEHQVAAASGSNGASNSQSRLLLAVPFIGKDVPSRSSEFAHPDVLIGLTILSYRYEGIRVSDLVRIVSQLKQDFSRQLGPRDQRPACVMFRNWVSDGLAKAEGAKVGNGGVLPLPLFQLRDGKQVSRLHDLVAKLADVVYYYARQHVFPSCMNFQKLKISACGHELGSNSLFAKRIGFSGTPSNLLPMDLGECYYEPCSDGSIFQCLTNPRVVSVERKVNWTAESLLLDIARADPPFHTLIDTGALITGFENQEVASFLLSHLPSEMEGVVYLDSEDRQMILLRDHNAPMPLVQCGLHPAKRFTFYDQVHTTGMDIKQCVNARAVLTLGKDMTFRDYAQGAYRMRGIETGQSIHLFMIPEVENRIRHEMSLTQSLPLADKTKSLNQYLLLVPAWLLTNSMRLESMQLVQLSLQELHNTWRKRALNSLLDEIGVVKDNVSKKPGNTAGSYSLSSRLRRFIGPEGSKSWLQQCINIFRVEISYHVEAMVPKKKELSDVIGQIVETHQSFVQSPEERARVEDVKQRLAHSSTHQVANDDAEQGDMRLTAEVVHENEAEAEEEAEEEAEQEEQKMSAFTRDDEHPIPWKVDVLTSTPEFAPADHPEQDGVFYPFSEFRAHTECPKIDFPADLLVSGNFFRRRWVGLGERRVKNVGLILEWSPQMHQEAMKGAMQYLFMEAMAATPGITPNDAAVKAIARASEIPRLWAEKCIPTDLHTAVAGATSSSSVFLVTLSLAEGETIRRMIHQNHPVFQTSVVRLRTCEGELVESSSVFAAWNDANAVATERIKKISTGIQCLRFFNNEMYYFPTELQLLLEGLALVPISLRHEFFECILRLRRRERHLWGDTPLAKVFTHKDEWHLLSARARMQQFQQSLKRKKKLDQLAPSLRRFDENEDGLLPAEDVLKCFENFQLGFSSGELNEIIALIADESTSSTTGGIPIETVCAAFGLSKQDVAAALRREDEALARQLAIAATGNEPWSCPVCTFVNETEATSCNACGETSPVLLALDQADSESSKPREQTWRCNNCTFINQGSDDICAICELDIEGQRGVPRGKWICAGEQGGCTFFNPMSNFYCEVCNRARPDLASTRF